MIGKIIDILEDNKKFVLSRLKKYTVKEYDAEIERRERESKKVMDSLMKLIENKKNITNILTSIYSFEKIVSFSV